MNVRGLVHISPGDCNGDCGLGFLGLIGIVAMMVMMTMGTAVL